ncbi:MAG: histidine kinase [Steroidobacteraceae bacterium]
MRERAAFYALGNDQQRIAYDLHDGVGQQLAGVALLVQSLTQELARRATRGPQTPPSSRACWRTRSRTCACSVAAFAGRQRPPRPRQRAAGAGRARASSGERSVTLALEVEEASALPPLDADHIYLIAEEAVTNALRHAGGAPHLDRAAPARCRVRAAHRGRRPWTGPGDIGAGHGTQAQHRARGLGATLTVTAASGGGTRLRCVRGAAVHAAAPG